MADIKKVTEGMTGAEASQTLYDNDINLNNDIAAAGNRLPVYNVTTEVPLPSGQYYVLATAIAAIPAAVRKLGLEITFATNTITWENWKFIGSVLSEWSMIVNWELLQTYDIYTELLPANCLFDSNSNIIYDTNSKGIGVGDWWRIRYPNDINNYVDKLTDNSYKISLNTTGGSNPNIGFENKLNKYSGRKFKVSCDIRGDSTGFVYWYFNNNLATERIEYSTNWSTITKYVNFGSNYSDYRINFYYPQSTIIYLRNVKIELVEDIVEKLVMENEINQYEINSTKNTVYGTSGTNLIDVYSRLNTLTPVIGDNAGKWSKVGTYWTLSKNVDGSIRMQNSNTGAGYIGYSEGMSDLKQNIISYQFYAKSPNSGYTSVRWGTYSTQSIRHNLTPEWTRCTGTITKNDFNSSSFQILFGPTSGTVVDIKDIILSEGEYIYSDTGLLDRTDSLENETYATKDINLTIPNYRYKAASIKRSNSGQCVIGFIGDSWTQGTPSETRYCTHISRRLKEKYGNAGGGFYSFSCSLTSAGDVTKMGCVDRNDASDERSANNSGLIVYRDQENGCRWVDAADALFKTGSFLELSILTSHTKLIIHFYAGTESTGIFTYKLDSGDAITVDTNSFDTGHNQIELNTSDAPHKLRFDIISGNVMLFGVDMQRNNPGMRLHMFGNKSSKTEDFIKVDVPVWQQDIISLNLDTICILLGTNDGLSATSTVYENLKKIINNIKEINTYIDIVIIMPSNRNAISSALTMDTQATYQYKVAKELKTGFINLIPLFGSQYQINSKGTFADTLHPNENSFLMIAEYLMEKIFV